MNVHSDINDGSELHLQCSAVLNFVEKVNTGQAYYHSAEILTIPSAFRNNYYYYYYYYYYYCGPGSSVGIATDYELDSSGSNPGGDEIFARPDRPWGPPRLL